MTFLSVSLPELDQEYIKQLDKRVSLHETIFKNILIDLASDEKEVEFFRNKTRKEIFQIYVEQSGYETRVSDFIMGPFSSENYACNIFGSFGKINLENDEALILIERSNNSWLKIYKVLENSEVELVKIHYYHQS